MSKNRSAGMAFKYPLRLSIITIAVLLSSTVCRTI